MTPTLKTILHTYQFDTRTPEGKAAWAEFKAARESGPHCHGPVLSDVFYAFQHLDGQPVELETKHLFSNQWNTPTLRVFDWALCSDELGLQSSAENAPQGIKRGHYLEQTDEMREIRRNTNVCGYCGHQEPAARGLVFCDRCRGSEYLKSSELHLTRMRSVDAGYDYRSPALSEAEKAHLLPLYREAQTHGLTEREKASRAKDRADIIETYAKATTKAKTEHDAKLWLLDHGIPSRHVIYYWHTGRFCFGWRGNGLDPEIVADILDVISEFRWPYDIKVSDGRTLSGN